MHRMWQRKFLTEISQLKTHQHYRLIPNLHYTSQNDLTLTLTDEIEGDDPPYSDIPKPPKHKSERKPYPTPMKILIKRAKKEKEARKAQPCRMLEKPPDNGLLVPELVEVANRVFRARESLILGLSSLVNAVPVQRCRYCFEVHIGNVGHEIRTCTGPKSGLRSATHVWRKGGLIDLVYFPKSFHLYDRVGKPRVLHDERSGVPRIPGIVELCIQAGLDLDKYPTKRRTKPVYSIEGRIVDFESVTESNEKICRNLETINPIVQSNLLDKTKELWHNPNCGDFSSILARFKDEEGQNLRELSTATLDSWLEMISGAKTIMEKYSVKTCGYCPEIQVGPKGHKLRMCKASKHQSRNGLHAWQEATIDDLVGPNYVWHVRDLNAPALSNNLKRFYGKAPAVVELCVQGGAHVPDQHRSMMRLDVIPPERDEVDLVT